MRPSASGAPGRGTPDVRKSTVRIALRPRSISSSRGVGQPEARAQGGSLVFRAERAAPLEQRHHPVDELVEPAGPEVRYEGEAVGGTLPHERLQFRGDRLGRADATAGAPASLTVRRIDSPFFLERARLFSAPSVRARLFSHLAQASAAVAGHPLPHRLRSRVVLFLLSRPTARPCSGRPLTFSPRQFRLRTRALPSPSRHRRPTPGRGPDPDHPIHQGTQYIPNGPRSRASHSSTGMSAPSPNASRTSSSSNRSAPSKRFTARTNGAPWASK